MSAGIQEVRKTTVTVSSGTGTAVVPQVWGIARRIRVIPPSESAVYDFSIKDSAGHLIMKRTDQEGTLSEAQYISMGIAYSVLIEDASADGTYTVKFDMH